MKHALSTLKKYIQVQEAIKYVATKNVYRNV